MQSRAKQIKKEELIRNIKRRESKEIEEKEGKTEK
jgi:hypothetical protein